MNEDVKTTMTRGDTWMRGLYMVLFMIFYGIAEFLIYMGALLNFGWMLFTGSTHNRVRDFSDDLTIYAYQVMQFLTFNSESKPFPFGPWPDEMDRPDADLFDEEDPLNDEVSEDTAPVHTAPDDTASDDTASEGDAVDDQTRDTGSHDDDDAPEPPRLIHG